jgi:voltage-gated potassium channel
VFATVPNSCGVYERLERRATEILVTLTLRKAVGLIVGVATMLATGAAVLVGFIDPAIGTRGDALWWAVTTVTTVGYGDVVPTNTAGRVVAAVLMLVGLGLIPLITSVVVSILVSQRSRESGEAQLEALGRIHERIDALERRLADEARSS